MAPYSAAKGAIIALTHSLAFELAKYKINVNCVCPGITDESGVWANVSGGYIKNLSMSRDEVIEEFTAKIPLKRLAQINDIVEYVFISRRKAITARGRRSIFQAAGKSIDGGLCLVGRCYGKYFIHFYVCRVGGIQGRT